VTPLPLFDTCGTDAAAPDPPPSHSHNPDAQDTQQYMSCVWDMNSSVRGHVGAAKGPALLS
jgi:hypothetical protein